MSILLVVLSLLFAVKSLNPRHPRFPHPSTTRISLTDPRIPPYRLLWFTQVKDHFDFGSTETFQQKVLICDEYYDKKPTSPVLFYTGNEGDISMFYNNTGAIFELAEHFNAIVVFVEHRYYGDSFPDKEFTFLSVEQALQDFASVITYLRDEVFHWDPVKAAVIAVGGSYGGMLTSWFRIKYPHVVDGALAGSAPNLHFPNFVDPYAYAEVITKVFADQGCTRDKLHAAFLAFGDLLAKQDWSKLSSYFHMCSPLQNASDANTLLGIIDGAFDGLSYANYPTPNSFLEPLPAWPVKAACKKFLPWSGWNVPLKGLFEIVNFYYNYTGDLKCLNLNLGLSPTLGAAWNYQACSQLMLPSGYNGVTDFYLPMLWNLSAYKAMCEKSYPNIRFSTTWMTDYFEGEVLRYASNIIFSNGKLDPWSSGGVYDENIGSPAKSSDVFSIVIENGAHHVDLRFSSPDDTPDITAARTLERDTIAKWIGDKLAR